MAKKKYVPDPNAIGTKLANSYAENAVLWGKLEHFKKALNSIIETEYAADTTVKCVRAFYEVIEIAKKSVEEEDE